MRSWPIVLLGLAVATAANPEVVKLRDKTFVKVSIKRDHVVTAGMMVGRLAPPGAGYTFMTRAIAIKAQELGFRRFAILKSKCDVVMMNGAPLYSQCGLTAQLLGTADQVTAEHKDEPRFVDVAATLAAPLPSGD